MNILLENANVKSYKGFEHREFYFNGHLANVIMPKNDNGRKKWIWRAEFLGAYDSVDVAMLEKGYYLVNYSISNMYGCPAAVELMKKFRDFLVDELGFEQKTILIGVSRGGLYSVNFAIKYPSLVNALYLDAPVLDISSWPGNYQRQTKEFLECVDVYGFDEKSFAEYCNQLPNRFKQLLDAKMPIAIIAGDSDDVVPHTENCQRLVDYYKENGGEYVYILKEGCGHHPHSMDNPDQVVEFLLKHS